MLENAASPCSLIDFAHVLRFPSFCVFFQVFFGSSGRALISWIHSQIFWAISEEEHDRMREEVVDLKITATNSAGAAELGRNRFRRC